MAEEHPRLAGFGILEADATQMFGIALAADNAGERDALVADDAATASYWRRINSPQRGSRLGAGDKAGLRLLYPVG